MIEETPEQHKVDEDSPTFSELRKRYKKVREEVKKEVSKQLQHPKVKPSDVSVIRRTAFSTLEEKRKSEELAQERLYAVKRELIDAKEQAMKDDLTGFYNRRFYKEELERSVLEAKRGGAQFSIVIIDFDDLSRMNNNYGHNTGDELLQGGAEIIRESIRKYDIPARIGGDEMAIIVRSQTPRATRVGERIRSSIERNLRDKMSVHESLQSPLTVSVGVVSYNPTSQISPSDLHSQADQAMYTSKIRGKNKVTLYTEGMTMPEGYKKKEL